MNYSKLYIYVGTYVVEASLQLRNIPAVVAGSRRELRQAA